MKKFSILILSLCMMLSLCACSGSSISDEEAAELFNQAPADDPEYKGAVYYLNINYEADEAWQKIAETYTAGTGIPVKVVSPEPGKYDEVFEQEMNKLSSPTLFHCGSKRALIWGDYCLDLKDSPVFEELAFPEFVIKNHYGAVSFLSCSMQSYGLLVNTALLAEAGCSLDEISDFRGLCEAAELIHDQTQYLEFDAFAPLPLGDSLKLTASRLGNVPLFYEFRDKNSKLAPAALDGTYSDNFRALWDLYTSHSALTPAELLSVSAAQSEAEFAEGRAVFYLADTGAYDRLLSAGMDPGSLAIMPVLCGVEGENRAALCTGPTDFWAVNNESDEKDIQATLDFMYWLVTSPEGLDMMMYNFGVLPFNASIHGGNSLETKASNLILEGNYPIQPAISLAPGGGEWQAVLSEALAKYTAGSGNWDMVISAYTQSWAQLYSEANPA